MPPWLNPVNWWKAVVAIRGIVSGVTSILQKVQEYLAKREVAKQHRQVDEVAKEIEKAKEIKDDGERLKAKADALCKLEKLANPDSDCDAPASDRR